MVGPSGAGADLSLEEQQQAIDWVNTTIRHPLGLPPLVHDSAIARAAQNHASYVVQNARPVDPLDFHGETPGRPGFTGVSPWHRCAAVGAHCDYEVGYPVGRGHDLPLADPLRGWLFTPFHGPPFFSACRVGFGQANGSPDAWVGNFSSRGCHLTGDLNAPPNTSSAALHVWPANGSTYVPVAWTGGEAPDPLENYIGDRKQVGPPIHMFYTGSRSTTATVTLKGPTGSIPVFRPFDSIATPSATVHLASGGGTRAVFPGKRLESGARYEITITPGLGVAAVNSFTTLAFPPEAVLSRPVIRLTRLRGRARKFKVSTTVRFSNVALPPSSDAGPREASLNQFVSLPDRRKTLSSGSRAIEVQNSALPESPFEFSTPTMNYEVTVNSVFSVPNRTKAVRLRLEATAPSWQLDLRGMPWLGGLTKVIPAVVKLPGRAR